MTDRIKNSNGKSGVLDYGEHVEADFGPMR